MDDIKAYLSSHPLGTGKLAPCEQALITLRKAGASYRYLCRYLASKGISAHPSEVQRFLNRRGRQQRVVGITNIATKPHELNPGELPKFEWPPKKKDESSW